MNNDSPIEIRPCANGFIVMSSHAPHETFSMKETFVFVDYAGLFKYIEGLYGPIVKQEYPTARPD